MMGGETALFCPSNLFSRSVFFSWLISYRFVWMTRRDISSEKGSLISHLSRRFWHKYQFHIPKPDRPILIHCCPMWVSLSSAHNHIRRKSNGTFPNNTCWTLPSSLAFPKIQMPTSDQNRDTVTKNILYPSILVNTLSQYLTSLTQSLFQECPSQETRMKCRHFCCDSKPSSR